MYDTLLSLFPEVNHMASAGTPKVVVRLDPDLRRLLEVIAGAKQITLSDALREAVSEYIRRNMIA